jgi:hypothetical protein
VRKKWRCGHDSGGISAVVEIRIWGFGGGRWIGGEAGRRGGGRCRREEEESSAEESGGEEGLTRDSHRRKKTDVGGDEAW